MPNSHETWMRRCFQLAAQGLGSAAPNPLVGSVIVHEDSILGEGYHTAAGQPHAEVEAFRSVTDRSKLSDATIYVNLEPCAHEGRTPACAPRIVREGVRRVVICNHDPFPKVDGRGLEILQEAGVEVITGVLEEEGRWLNRRFFTQVEKRRPYVILKWAQSTDGFIAPQAQDPGKIHWITQPTTQSITHRWRAEESAILVGAGTVLKDNPSLTVRAAAGPHPLRVVLDDRLETAADASVYTAPGQYLVVHDPSLELNGRKGLGVKRDDNFLPSMLHGLVEQGVQSIIVEGGRSVLEQFIHEGLWDEARIWTGSTSLENGVPAPLISGREIARTEYGADTLCVRLPS